MSPVASRSRRRLRLDIEGAVQGVGFRPHVYRLARELGLDGWIVNDTEGVRIEVEGEPAVLTGFAHRLRTAPPPRARILGVREVWLEPSGVGAFHIRHSEARGAPTVAVLPDLATCPACRADIADPDGRRHGYAFTNCTQCGPRLSIVRDLPYDRPRTTMAGFSQCPDCLAEYGDPADRRFHAQPNACSACGPRLAWIGAGAGPAPSMDGSDRSALATAAAALRDGRIVAVKGLGGFHLMVDATDDDAVARLRARKGREAKPLAVMVVDADAAATLAEVSDEERRLLESAEAPIVLLSTRADAPLSPAVAPGNPRVGVMLAYTPLHHLLLEAVDRPVVATSGNRSDEPICIDTDEATTRLRGIADGYLVHDRPIQRPVDDSVAVVLDRIPRVLRRSRGFAPLPIALPVDAPALLAVGGHLKNTVAVTRGRHAFVSQHIGDLDTVEAREAFDRTIRDYLRLYRVDPVAVAHDLHPDYASTLWLHQALDPDLPRVPVQHHHAHLAAVLAERGASPDGEAVLGVVWDGTGYGPDGTIWGGEFLLGGYASAARVGHLRTFPLPGGERAVREPRRSALGLLLETGLADAAGAAGIRAAFSPTERRVLERAVERGVQAPTTSSAGRLFDALSALLGLHLRSRFEGDAAMALEFAADPGERGAYPLPVADAPSGSGVLDWEPLLRAVLRDRRAGTEVGLVAARIHNALADGIVALAGRIAAETVVLSGGCFQNRLLFDRTVDGLRRRGHRVWTPCEVPPGDGGISLGQAAVATVRLAAPPSAFPPPSPPTGV